jgi:glycosyltransferase involved in cell wall biosynthesis
MKKTHIIIPCYNESERLPRCELVAFLEANSWASVGFVNDGSADDTIGVLRELQSQYPERIDVLDLEQNVGKGEAVRRGILDSLNRDYELVAFLDADFATPPEALQEMFEAARPEHWVIFGARVHRAGASIERDAARHYVGRAFASLASLTLDISLYDTQCGAKLFARDLVSDLFSEPFLTRWLFDLEILMRLRKLVGQEEFDKLVYEHPLSEWVEKGDSRIRFRDAVAVPYDLLRIRLAYGS